MSLPVLETARLVLRQPTEDDADELVRVCDDMDVARWTARIPNPYTRQDALERIAAIREISQTGEEAMFTAFDKADGHLVGLCGVEACEDCRSGEIGYLMGKQDWGRGLATEMVTAALQYGFGALGFGEILAAAVPENKASIRIQEKLGFQYRENWVRNAPARGCAFNLEVRALTREVWSHRHGG